MWATSMNIICSVSSLLSLHFVFVLQIEQDFRLLFGELTANKFLEKWPTSIKAKVITESHGLVPSTELRDLRKNAESTVVDENGTGTVFNYYCLSQSVYICYILIIGLQAGTVTCQPFCCSSISCHHLPRAGRGQGRCRHVRQWNTSSDS